MARLCYEESSRWKENAISEAGRFLDFEKEFLDNHIQAWVPAFLTEALDEAKTGFYRAILELTQGYIKTDQRYLTSRL